jgi:hypothetical protein
MRGDARTSKRVCLCEVGWRVRRETTLTLQMDLSGIYCGLVLIGGGTRYAGTYMTLSKPPQNLKSHHNDQNR